LRAGRREQKVQYEVLESVVDETKAGDILRGICKMRRESHTSHNKSTLERRVLKKKLRRYQKRGAENARCNRWCMMTMIMPPRIPTQNTVPVKPSQDQDFCVINPKYGTSVPII
jgi:Mg2+ and Co2+ transporter CorA